jgi:hypothetical protein
MKAILIDPEHRSIEYVETPLELPDIYRLIGADTFDACRPFRGLREIAFVDDFGAYKPLARFTVSGFQYPLFGKTLVCGFNDAGTEVSTNLTIEQIHDLIEFE